jgi:hypothetical protein
MTQATDTDIRDLKIAIDTLSRTNETIARTTEVNTKAIADLTVEMRTGFSGIREEMRVGFANVDTKFADIKGDIRELRSDIKALDGKFDEKTKNLDQRMSSGEFISRGVAVGLTVTVVGGLLLTFSKILFFGKIF